MFVRGTKERGTSQQELVLACYKCNNLRGRVSEFYNTAIVNLQAGIPIHKVVKNLDKALKDFEERIGKKEHGFNREF